MWFVFILFLTVNKTCGFSISSSFFNHWHCVGIFDEMDFSQPIKFQVGELPLVMWNNIQKETPHLSTTLNVCKHMGSQLNKGHISAKGCLVCPYHGLEYFPNQEKDVWGKTVVHEGKVFWSLCPIQKNPPSTPFFNHSQFYHSFIEVTMPCSLTDSAYNTMDLQHPAFVHNNAFGFGSLVPPKNVKMHHYPNLQGSEKVGLSFDYASSSVATQTPFTQNFHMYNFPSFTWSRVTSKPNRHLFISVHLLPISPKETKWFVTVVHNFIHPSLMQMMARTILAQDFLQMRQQSPESPLKREMLFRHSLEHEEPIKWLKTRFDAQYKYPDMKMCLEAVKIRDSMLQHKDIN
jgi:phenylpropionate dioxygenase-like ring-hydroxylating dioxygenase large terminal subunit